MDKRLPSAVPIPVDGDITGVYEGEELEQRRSRRPTPERLRILERKHDDLAKVVNETNVTVANMSGKLDVLPELVSMVREQADRAVERQDKREDAEHENQLDIAKHRRTRVTQAVGWFFTGGGLVLLLKLLGVL